MLHQQNTRNERQTIGNGDILWWIGMFKNKGVNGLPLQGWNWGLLGHPVPSTHLMLPPNSAGGLPGYAVFSPDSTWTILGSTSVVFVRISAVLAILYQNTTRNVLHPTASQGML